MSHIAAFIERRPGLGILASLTGFSTSVVSLFQTASVIIGLGGAIFGLLAGYYTYRIKKSQWDKLQHRNEKTSD